MGRERHWFGVLAALAVGACAPFPATSASTSTGASTSPGPQSCPPGSYSGGDASSSDFDFILRDQQGNLVFCKNKSKPTPAIQGNSGECHFEQTTVDGELCGIHTTILGRPALAALVQATADGVTTQTLTLSASGARNWVGTTQSRTGTGDRFVQIRELNPAQHVWAVGYTVAHCTPKCATATVVVVGAIGDQIDVIWRSEQTGVPSIENQQYGYRLLIDKVAYEWNGSTFAAAPTFAPDISAATATRAPATSTVAQPTRSGTPVACTTAIAEADAARNAAYDLQIALVLNDKDGVGRASLVFASAKERYEAVAPACRAWAIANGGASVTSNPGTAWFCLTTLANFDRLMLIYVEMFQMIIFTDGRAYVLAESPRYQYLNAESSRGISAWHLYSGACR